ncbi:3'-5' exonuclease [Chryseolinea sp. H1M3-3]|jgi:DNA polymerase III subunit epsilon|uniref:3'-5' exonuclease n=1 Tax=Chryseolinea sp. H1M3-3 TaxID=3034144 RepID=UPI0023EC9435|nr:3'-5' exonuclease [Chryseolinea sp. H1M3-3]
MKLNLRNPLCIFDLETTGTNITQDRIIEIAVIKLMPNGETIRKANVLNPTIPILPESTAIHGISPDDVKDKPTFKEVAKDYIRFFEGADLAGFNVLKFDIPMLVEEFLRAGVDFDYGRKKIVDAQKIFHLMEKRTLAAAYRFYLNKDFENSHTAEADTQATMEVLLAQVAKYEGQDVVDSLDKKIGRIQNDVETLSKLTSSGMVDLACRMVLNSKGEEVFNFGKHKNKLVTAVFKEEPSYYDWMMNGDFPLDTKRKLTEIKLRSFKK